MADTTHLLRRELEKPVTAHDEELTVLELRVPTGDDIFNIGVIAPEGMDENGEGGTMHLPTAEFAARLANVPPSTIKKLHHKDAMAVAKVVNPFLLEYLGTYGG